MSQFTAIDLFAGAGGFSLAAHELGFCNGQLILATVLESLYLTSDSFGAKITKITKITKINGVLKS